MFTCCVTLLLCSGLKAFSSVYIPVVGEGRALLCNRRLSLGRREDPPAELPRDRRAAHGTEQRSERSGLLSRHAFKARGARDVLRDRNHPCGYVINCGAREGINSGIVPVSPPPPLPPSLPRWRWVVDGSWSIVSTPEPADWNTEPGAPNLLSLTY